jgi:hypothetical protein
MIIVTKDNDNSILMECTKNNISIRADHNIVGDLYSINMQVKYKKNLINLISKSSSMVYNIWDNILLIKVLTISLIFT